MDMWYDRSFVSLCQRLVQRGRSVEEDATADALPPTGPTRLALCRSNKSALTPSSTWG